MTATPLHAADPAVSTKPGIAGVDLHLSIAEDIARFDATDPRAFAKDQSRPVGLKSYCRKCSSTRFKKWTASPGGAIEMTTHPLGRFPDLHNGGELKRKALPELTQPEPEYPWPPGWWILPFALGGLVVTGAGIVFGWRLVTGWLL